MPGEWIEIGEPEITGGRVSFGLTASPGAAKFLRESRFWFEEPSLRDPARVPAGILAIPVVGNVMPLAWAIGAEVRVPTLDRAFVGALERIATTIARLYPHFAVGDTRLAVADPREHPPATTDRPRMGLLFSGGVDSTTSLIDHRKRVTDLFSVWGADVATADAALWERGLAPLLAAHPVAGSAAKHVVKSNLREFVDELRLCRMFGAGLTNASWWGSVQHGLGLVSLAAPIAFERGIGELLIASTHSEAFSRPWGSMPSIDKDIAWSGTTVRHDGFHRTRQQKIAEVIAPYARAHDGVPIAACYVPGRGADGVLNCGACEKCTRTQVGLLLAGVDPATCGFATTPETLATIRERLEGRRYTMGEDEVFMWGDIRDHIPARDDEIPDRHGSRAQLAWLRGIDPAQLASPAGPGVKPAGSFDPMYIVRRAFRLLPPAVQQRIYRMRARR